MNKLMDYLSDFLTGGVKFIVMIATLSIGAYNFVLTALDERTDNLRREMYQLRGHDTKIIHAEIDNLKKTVDDGFKDIKNQNQSILNHLLNRRR